MPKQTRARGRANQRKWRQVEFDRPRRRPVTDHDVELVVLHCGIQNLLDHRAEAVDFIDEQHVVGLEVGQNGGEIARLLQHRARSLAQVHLHFVGDDVRQGRLAKTRRAENQHVIERFLAFSRGADKDIHLLAHLFLADVIGQQLRPQRSILRQFLDDGFRADEPILAHRFTDACSAFLINCDALDPPSACCCARAIIFSASTAR